MKEDLLEDEREDDEDGYSSDEDFVAEDDPEDKSIRKLRLAEFQKNIQAKDEKMITSYLQNRRGELSELDMTLTAKDMTALKTMATPASAL